MKELKKMERSQTLCSNEMYESLVRTRLRDASLSRDINIAKYTNPARDTKLEKDTSLAGKYLTYNNKLVA